MKPNVTLLGTPVMVAILAAPASAQVITEVFQTGVGWKATGFFLFFVMLMLLIVYKSARRTRTAKDFYSTGGGISAAQNGLAIAGDYMSAASFLGITGLIYMYGYDGFVYSVGFLVGWPIILFLIAEQLRNLGKYTFADVASYRLQQRPVRMLAACGSLAVVFFYLTAQMIGGGKLIQILFGIPYSFSVIVIGLMMIFYVSYGGMLATTWVQIIKAIMLLFGATFMAVASMYVADFSYENLSLSAIEFHRLKSTIMVPGNFLGDPISAISLGIALILGAAGLPHILMRFFTVADAKAARKSVLYATGFIGYFYILTFTIGFGAIILVSANPNYLDMAGRLMGGENMVALHLAHAVGGEFFLGFISAVGFTTILAVVSALTLSGATAIAHDLYGNLLKKKVTDSELMSIGRRAALAIGLVAIVLGLIFEGQNIALMVGIAFSIAASANFPVLFLAMFWPRLTTRGAVIGGSIGLITVLLLIITGPVVWQDVLGFSRAIFPWEHPAIFSVPLAFVSIWYFSVTDRSDRARLECEAFKAQYVRAQTGIEAEGIRFIK
ncbi:cation/acetate symporter ActP [Desulfurispira natronophila]|uniref:Cation/acetate symporter ActP n=1 Tax=Desulfurispira natronophila TaxID=682562 RepID=A0A7W7Y3Q4_9BACT|nr:cation/acetate symporter ActP [Desulfurispira natronophila]MBB5021469.1 cation/acetate symporter [Desulfurispira natronophila]